MSKATRKRQHANEQEQVRKASLRKVAQAIGRVVGALGLLATLITIYAFLTTKITVSPLKTLVDSDPFSTAFSVANSGDRTLYDPKVFLFSSQNSL